MPSFLNFSMPLLYIHDHCLILLYTFSRGASQIVASIYILPSLYASNFMFLLFNLCNDLGISSQFCVNR